ncbi:uncharacterized protein LOC122618607 [Drosophila teissieri]|uniref:uncharacterized protein LOC122618607 n=1 Tax=Drosophila teissieri TaxID=7243 RepID=UPI001CB9EDDF|nr:uncharacterized protein LOC122618607 [Drosophila teissieri]
MKISANFIPPPPLGSDVPRQDPLKGSKHLRLELSPVIIGTVVALITAALVVSFNNYAAYLLTQDGKLAIAALIYVLIVHLLIFRKAASNIVLIYLYAAAQVLTLPYCVSLIRNIRPMIDGQFERQECVMAAMGLVPDIISLSFFIVSMCINWSSNDSGSSSGGSSGGSSGNSSDS